MHLLIFLSLFIIQASARKGFGNGEQDWGYVDVRTDAHLFWWLYYTTANVTQVTDRPLIIWLQGGPGASSTGYGNIQEIGPLDENLNTRNNTWIKDVNVMFVDNPVGTGFSYVENNGNLTRNNQEIAQDLVELIRVFLIHHQEFRNVPLYITSESYGGKMASEFALLLQKKIDENQISINLKGVMLISPWISPIDLVLESAPFLYYLGAVDQKGYDEIQKVALSTKEMIDKDNYLGAFKFWRLSQRVIDDKTAGIDFYDVLEKIPTKNTERLLYDLMNNQVKNSLNLNVTWSSQNDAVFQALSLDFMKPVTHTVETLLNTTNLKVFVVSGQLDLIVNSRGTIEWVNNLNWTESDKWINSPRDPLSVSGVNEGYVKKLGNFTFYWVNRAGHMVPKDNPSAMTSILRDFTDNFQV